MRFSPHKKAVQKNRVSLLLHEDLHLHSILGLSYCASIMKNQEKTWFNPNGNQKCSITLKSSAAHRTTYCWAVVGVYMLILWGKSERTSWSCLWYYSSVKQQLPARRWLEMGPRTTTEGHEAPEVSSFPVVRNQGHYLIQSILSS